MENLCEKNRIAGVNGDLCEKDVLQGVVDENNAGAKDDLREKINALHLRFSEYGRNARAWSRKCMLLLPEIDKYRVWKRKGFTCIYEYAAKLAGLSREQVNESLRVLGKIEDKPALMEVARDKGVWAVRPVSVIATKETEKFWAEKVRSMTVNELATYVRDFGGKVGVQSGGIVPDFGNKIGGQNETTSLFGYFGKDANRSGGRDITASQPGKNVGVVVGGSAVPRLSGTEMVDGCATMADAGNEAAVQTVAITMQLSPETAERFKKLKGDKNWDEFIGELVRLKEEQIEKEKPEPVATESRHIPVEIERYVRARDGNTCAFPGCFRACAEMHHVDGFALEHVHDPDRIFCLCEAHHGLAHRGLIENENLPARFWRVRKDPDPADVRVGIDRKVVEHRMVGCHESVRDKFDVK